MAEFLLTGSIRHLRYRLLNRLTGTEELNGKNAPGPLATELTFSILSDLELWITPSFVTKCYRP